MYAKRSNNNVILKREEKPIYRVMCARVSVRIYITLRKYVFRVIMYVRIDKFIYKRLSYLHGYVRTYTRARALSLTASIFVLNGIYYVHCTYSRRRSPLPSSRIILSRIEGDAFYVSFDSLRAGRVQGTRPAITISYLGIAVAKVTRGNCR